MKLGTYEFEWVPDEMDIPRPEKTVAVQQNFGNVGYFSWGPQLIGKEVKMKWKFVSIAQYAEFKAMFLAGGVHVLDLSSEEIYIPPPDGGGGAVDYSSYPDPLHPGVYPGPPYKRYYIGPTHIGSFVLDNYVYWNWNVVNAAWMPNYNGYAKVINVADPDNAYLEFAPDGADPFPDFRVGDTIFDNLGFIWATVVPWDAELRPYYLYPNPPSETDKIYYSDVVNGFPGYTPGVLNVGDIVYLDYGETGYCIITEMGADAVGTWFRCRAAVEAWAESTLITWTAGNVGNVDVGTAAMFNVMPWGPVIGGPFG